MSEPTPQSVLDLLREEDAQILKISYDLVGTENGRNIYDFTFATELLDGESKSVSVPRRNMDLHNDMEPLIRAAQFSKTGVYVDPAGNGIDGSTSYVRVRTFAQGDDVPDAILKLFRNPNTRTVNLGYGSVVTDSGRGVSISVFTNAGRDVNPASQTRAALQCSTRLLYQRLGEALIAAGFRQESAFVDPRGGIEGESKYVRP